MQRTKTASCCSLIQTAMGLAKTLAYSNNVNKIISIRRELTTTTATNALQGRLSKTMNNDQGEEVYRPDPRKLQRVKGNTACKICYKSNHDENKCPVLKIKLLALEKVNTCYVCQTEGHQWPNCNAEQFLWDKAEFVPDSNKFARSLTYHTEPFEEDTSNYIQYQVDDYFMKTFITGKPDSDEIGKDSEEAECLSGKYMQMTHAQFEAERAKEMEIFNQLSDIEKKNYQQQLAHVPPKIPRQRFGMSVAKFLTAIGRGCEEHVDKFESWEELFSCDSLKLKLKGINIQHCKYILAWKFRYRYGVEPYAMKTLKKDRTEEEKKKIVEKKEKTRCQKPRGNKEMSYKAGEAWSKAERSRRKKDVLLTILKQTAVVKHLKKRIDLMQKSQIKSSGKENIEKVVDAVTAMESAELGEIKDSLKTLKDTIQLIDPSLLEEINEEERKAYQLVNNFKSNYDPQYAYDTKNRYFNYIKSTHMVSRDKIQEAVEENYKNIEKRGLNLNLQKPVVRHPETGVQIFE